MPKSKKTGRPPSPKSKRQQEWVSLSVLIKPETRARLQQVVALGKGFGIEKAQDQSDIVETALQCYLPQVEHSYRMAVYRHTGVDIPFFSGHQIHDPLTH